MGVVIRESIKSSFASYTGLIIGLVNVVFLYTKFLSPDQFGLVRVLQDSSLLFVSFAQLGTPFILIKFFPKFFNGSKDDNGFLFFIISFSFIGFLIFTILFFSLQATYLNFYVEKSPLILQYFYYVAPLVFGLVYINILESYLITFHKVFVQTFVREVFLKILNTIIILLFAFKFIGFNGFIILLVASYLLSIVILTIYAKKIGGLILKPNFKFLKHKDIKKIWGYGLFTVVGGLGYLVASKIDTIMLPAYTGLGKTAIYSLALLIATIMEMPKKNLVNSVLSSLSTSINEKNYKLMDEIYKKTSLNLLIFGLLIFLLVWLNIDDLFKIIPNGNLYQSGKHVLFFLLLTRLADLATGVNNEIILYSKYYIYGLVLIVILAILTVITNMIFIPIFGIIGAAIANMLSVSTYFLLEVILIWKKFRSQPFVKNTVISILISVIILFAFREVQSLVMNLFSINLTNSFSVIILMAVRSTIVGLIFVFTFWKLKLSAEFNAIISKSFEIVKARLSS